ncbi:Crp/Fnr family transcriptional regulator [Flagellimonas flava]|uniref:cAMP-binding domain of CRP or a regulatory subunit of cAMP-dependent protein kinases n=1 Tax=Flagellimonas flava TaxID=570519 RepID=A0A1M5K4V2_9FLAO|nr:Crp/Fnr family transcriptional regulator [Allomuricauda flava]SHG47867.1 cAMP-binding domain of CRP or a regulatory subunit of cAMP-dependent protein kinases [Allomuricauda flava]
MISFDHPYSQLFYKYVNSFATVSQSSFEAFLPLIGIRDVQKGENIIYHGQTARNIFFVCEGILVSQWMDDEANVYIKNFFVEGHLAGSTVSMLTDTPSGFGVECVVGGAILEMNYKRYKEVIYGHEDLKNYYIANLEQNWIIENERRQISFAAESATERYISFLNRYPKMPQRVPQWLIASYLGITPTQLSRIRKGL